MAGYQVWEFWGRGDPFFGGNADDRILYEVEPGYYQFLSSSEASRIAALLSAGLPAARRCFGGIGREIGRSVRSMSGE
jgi:hypothetical protein